MSKNVIIFFVILLNIGSFAKDNIPNSKFYIGNGLIEKVVDLKNDSLISISLLHSEDHKNFIRNSKEFSFLLNNHQVDGFSGWKFDSTQDISDENNGIGINLTISSKTITGLTLKLNYLTYPNLPLIRKWITITNNSKSEFKLEKLNIENLHSVFDQIHSIVLHNYARMKHIGRFVGNWDDPLVVIHDQKNQRGIALGNEAPGVLKRTAFHTEGSRNNIEIGMTHPNQSFPFRKWIKPGESFTTPKIFICLYSNRSDAFKVVNEEVNHFVTLHMNPRILQLKEKPTFVYNTWNPFRTFVNDTLMMSVADAAAECGLQEMIIDWQDKILR